MKSTAQGRFLCYCFHQNGNIDLAFKTTAASIITWKRKKQISSAKRTAVRLLRLNKNHLTLLPNQQQKNQKQNLFYLNQ